jgi:diguanylate cyclase (GGDEF)-like protein
MPTGTATRRGRHRNVSQHHATAVRWPTRLIACLALLGLVCVLVGVELETQGRAHSDIQARFGARATSAAQFMDVYVADLLTREHHLAGERLSAPVVSQADLAAFTDDLGFGPAVLLDGDGRDLAVTPSNPAIVGTQLSSNYAHLRSAEAGIPTVSSVLPSAVRQGPIVAFATPFDTPSGRRVVSGAFDLRTTPLGPYLGDILSLKGGHVALVDSTGTLIAASGGTTNLDPGLVAAVKGHKPGDWTATSGEHNYFASAPVKGTPWRLIVSYPTNVLYRSANQAGKTFQWMLVGLLAGVAALVAVEFVRSLEAKRFFAVMAGQDVLTALPNRRETEERLAQLLSSARRHDHPLALLMVDIDHFKSVNDRSGHAAGDVALRSVAHRIEQTLRSEDIVGRWGGEEFVVLLPETDGPGAMIIAERVRDAISIEGYEIDGDELSLTVSIGAATMDGGTADDLVARADAALYRSKGSGRDCVTFDGAPPAGAALVTSA